MTKPLLDLETLIVRPAILIDGERYEILAPDELSVLDHQRFETWRRRLEDLQKSGEESPELDEIVAAIAARVLVGVPEDVAAKLTGSHRLAVAEVFTGLLLRSRMSVAGAVATAIGNPAIGDALFPGFNGSTAARRGNGWRARLSAWFARTFG